MFRVREFAIRRNSGGDGKYCGGDGVIRHFIFRKDIDVAILSQRRTTPPFGLKGGKLGKPDENIRVFTGGTHIALEGNVAYHAVSGEELIIRTPGGGAYGK